MISCKVFITLLLLVLPLSTLQAPVAQPPSNAPARARKYKTRTKLPNDLNLSTTSLRQLVDMKPREIISNQGDLYKQYFANHPRVKVINLHDKETALTAHQLVSLTTDGTHDKSSKVSVNASIKNLIDETSFHSDQHRLNLVKNWEGVKFLATRRRGTRQQASKLIVSERRKQVRESEIRFKERTGISYGIHKRRNKKDPIMNQPLPFHLAGASLSAKDAEEKARLLRPFYSSDNILTKELHSYLKEKNTPLEQINAAIGLRQKYVQTVAIARRKMDKNQLSTSSAQHGNEYQSQRSDPPSSQPFVSTPEQHPLPHTNPASSPSHSSQQATTSNDPETWDWLHQMNLS